MRLFIHFCLPQGSIEAGVLFFFFLFLGGGEFMQLPLNAFNLGSAVYNFPRRFSLSSYVCGGKYNGGFSLHVPAV